MSDKPKIHIEDKAIYSLMKNATITLKSLELKKLIEDTTLDPSQKNINDLIKSIEDNANSDGEITLKGHGTNDFQII